MKYIPINSNGQWVMVGAVHPVTETRTLIILGTMDWRFHTPLTSFSDSQILDVLTACSDVGKILESKGFKIIY
ncbi:hypothetical protein CAL7716_085330 [Calothrix sp. PCC 7716]|nr:hypothetical protein CAL7716_085330 [Calothrix sp. PCC 7716]